jgi:hypothetical protein
MPLYDHAKSRRLIPWKPFHDNWVIKMVDRLNETVLSSRFTSMSGSHLGIEVEIDVAALEREAVSTSLQAAGGNGVAVAPLVYAPPAPPLTAGVSFTDEGVFEVRVYHTGSDWRVVAAVELVSERNKDRPAARREFAVKCAGYLQSGVSVVVVDIVPDRPADLHLDLCDLLDLPEPLRWKSPTGLSAVCYRTVQGAKKPGLTVGNGQVRLDAWPHALAVGDELPTVPLWLAADLAVPLELELTYAAACKSLRLG